jgi:BMFP domain-containing protein YqiC
MLPPDLISDLKKCAEDPAALLNSIRIEVKQEAEIMARSLVSKMNLVPREEFDALQAVLLRTREKLESLQAELDSIQKPD